METSTNENTVVPEPEVKPTATTDSTSSTTVPADSAMATGTDDEPEMTIGDKHAGDAITDSDGDGELSSDEAATLLGAD